LLLAILVMASLTLITLAVGAFVIQESRASRAVALSEPTIAAADSGGEQGLWAIKRAATISTCPSQSSQNLGAGTLINLCKSYDTAVVSVKAGVPLPIYLYDPNNINGDVDLSGYPYSSITVGYSGGTSLVTVNVTRLDGNTTGINPSSSSVSPGGVSTINISPVAAGSEGRLQVVLSSIGDVTLNVNTDRGMPTYPTVKSIACGSRTTVVSCNTAGQEIFIRQINVSVPQ
jgi:Tfp pilus assembly protein PilX